MEPAAARRTFLTADEIAGLALGAVRGEPVALRRILGARRGGRIGIALAVVAGALAAPAFALPWLTLLGLALGLALRLVGRRAHGLSAREYLRLWLWLVAPLCLLAAPVRLVEPDSLSPGLFGVLLAHLALARGVRHGLGDRAAAPGVRSPR